MLTLIADYFFEEPRRFQSVGGGLVWTGSTWLLAGAVGHTLTAIQGVMAGLGHQAAAPQSLAALYPTLWTWWVPETIFGCLPAVLLIVAGIQLSSFGKRLLRHIG